MQNNIMHLFTIDRRSTVHYATQIKESIKGMILDRTLYYKTNLPTIEQLAQHLDITTRYVERAYHELDEEHYIKQEDGQFHVSYIELTDYFFERNTSIVDAVKALGLKPSITCLEKRVLELSDKERKNMGFDLEHENRYLYINRIYYGDQRPIIILENYIPLYIFPHLEDEFQGHEGLNNYIQEHYGFSAYISKRVTTIVNLPKDLASLLNERVNAASLRSTNHVYDKYGRLIDFGCSHSISSYYFQAITHQQEWHTYKQQFKQAKE
jgi:DNA-binding GntR family transcriptional regulator